MFLLLKPELTRAFCTAWRSPPAAHLGRMAHAGAMIAKDVTSQTTANGIRLEACA